MKPLLLIIDDDKEFVSDFVLLLEGDFNCISANNGREGIRLMEIKHPDVILLDLMFQGEENGIEILKQIKRIEPDMPTLMITDYSSIETAIKAMKLGASDYISKTPNLNELKIIIDKTLKERILKYRTEFFEEQIGDKFKDIIGDAQATLRLKESIAALADNSNTVLITGESGAGKELVARKLHELSDRKDKPFIAINCAALAKDIVESELFGHERGAFTGAEKRKPGKFEIAEDGTIFLDEISELDRNVQVKLLRTLQEKEFERVGGNGTLKAKCRILAATNKNLKDCVIRGEFREDLFYRLDVLRINVPPLRERKEDIPQLIKYFIETLSHELNVPPKQFSEETMKSIMDHDWPGNIRELKNHITRLLFQPETRLYSQSELIKSEPSLKIPETWGEMDKLRKETADKASREVEKLFLQNLLKKFNSNISKAAEHIGINRSNLHKMINKCGLNGD